MLCLTFTMFFGSIWFNNADARFKLIEMKKTESEEVFVVKTVCNENSIYPYSASKEMLINQTEAQQIVCFISSYFNKVSKQYNFNKYPKWKYNQFKLRFSQLKPTNQDIHDALVWKYGHWGKPNFPAAHRKLISEVQVLWPQFVKTNNCFSPVHTFQWWQSKWPKTRYITVAFITHLIHHKSNIPIIDQHNFRAMNDLISGVRKHYSYKEKPSSWQDIMNLKEFMETLLPFLTDVDFPELDRFLMMWGKHVKKQSKHVKIKNSCFGNQ